MPLVRTDADRVRLAGDAGALLVAREEGRPAGCVAWQRLGPDVAEVRNLWVGAEARGLGLGRRLLGAVETDAAAHGIAVMRLGTHRVLTEAIALYRSSGYREISPYDESPYYQLAFEKSLTSYRRLATAIKIARPRTRPPHGGAPAPARSAPCQAMPAPK